MTWQQLLNIGCSYNSGAIIDALDKTSIIWLDQVKRDLQDWSTVLSENGQELKNAVKSQTSRQS